MKCVPLISGPCVQIDIIILILLAAEREAGNIIACPLPRPDIDLDPRAGQGGGCACIMS